jgi:hypothetical protein
VKITVYKDKTKHINGRAVKCNVADELKKTDDDFIFIEKESGRDITRKCLLNLIKSNEPSDSDINLNQIIRSGGFSQYIKSL